MDYDYDGLSDSSNTVKYTAYGALCNGKAVCNGYAVLFYRMCKEAGLSVRIISGTANGGSHAWNIVKVGDVYYAVDSTWDGQDAQTLDQYLLKSEKISLLIIQGVQNIRQKNLTMHILWR